MDWTLDLDQDLDLDTGPDLELDNFVPDKLKSVDVNDVLPLPDISKFARDFKLTPEAVNILTGLLVGYRDIVSLFSNSLLRCSTSSRPTSILPKIISSSTHRFIHIAMLLSEI